MFKLIIMFLLCKYVPKVFGQTVPPVRTLSPPGDPKWIHWAERLPSLHVTNLTRELLADITLKFEHSRTIQSQYKYGKGYEIGTIASAIKDSFEYMLQIYRNYVGEENFTNSTKAELPDFERAFAIIQGEYNKIRLERNLFVQILLKFATAEADSLDSFDNLGLTPEQQAFLNKMKNNKQNRRRRLADTEVLVDETFWNSDLDLEQLKTKDQTKRGSSIHLKKSAEKSKTLWKPKENTRKAMNLDLFD